MAQYSDSWIRVLLISFWKRLGECLVLHRGIVDVIWSIPGIFVTEDVVELKCNRLF